MTNSREAMESVKTKFAKVLSPHPRSPYGAHSHKTQNQLPNTRTSDKCHAAVG